MASGMAAVPTFDEVVYGWDDECNPMNKVCFVTKPKWYDWNVTAGDDCDERVDVVLWSRKKPECDGEDTACCMPPGSQWLVDDPSFAFVRFFEMDLRNCDNISRIDLEIPVCCLCDEDIMWGVWEWVEEGACDITECDPDCTDQDCDSGCGCECSWVPLDTEFVKECESPICDGEECDCKLELGFSGALADDCNVGELCELEDKVFALGWVAPYVVEDVLDNGIPYTVKAWACDPRRVVKADLVQNAINPDDSITSDDPLFFRLDFEPGTGEGICKVEVSWILECSEQDLIGFYYWDDDAENWVELAATWTEIGGGECEVSIVFEGDISDLPGVVIGGGDSEIFDPAPVTPDPEPEPEPEPEPTPTPTTSSSGGCNVGTGAAVLLLLVPLGVLWFKRF
jgi:Synergist-CTERM protein sorting domain-containing protein